MSGIHSSGVNLQTAPCGMSLTHAASSVCTSNPCFTLVSLALLPQANVLAFVCLCDSLNLLNYTLVSLTCKQSMGIDMMMKGCEEMGEVTEMVMIEDERGDRDGDERR